MTRPFTGRHMALILVSFFGVVIAVNFTMAWFATTTFGGLVVENSYVASQKFNGWLEKAREQKALGWQLDAARAPDARLIVTLDSGYGPLADAHLRALVRHPLGQAPERTLRFRAIGEGRYESMERLEPGRWIIHIHVDAHGRQLDRIVDLS